MNTEARFQKLLTASPDVLAAVDAALDGTPAQRVPLRLLRMKTAAAETSLSRSTLWRAIREGRLKAVEIRKGSFRIPEAELRRFVEGKAV